MLTVTAEVLKRGFFRVEGVGESLRTEGETEGKQQTRYNKVQHLTLDRDIQFTVT